MQTIIGRDAEKAELQDMLDSKRPELVVVYGRRRVGKTFLVREFFDGNFAFYHTGLSKQELDDKNMKISQLQNFASSLRRYGKENQVTPLDWFSAFDDLRSLLEEKMADKPNENQVVFIDELPWMDTPRSGFLTALEHFWNGWGAGKPRLKMIVCGSATAWISDNLLHNKGGLYNRQTRQIKLHPFSLYEAELFYKENNVTLDRYAQAQLYMMLGGIPYYMSFVKPGNSVEQTMSTLFMGKDAKLSEEFNLLFSSLFTNHQECINIIRFLAKRKNGYTREEIAREIGVSSGGGLTDTLNALEKSDFIQKYVYHGLPSKENRYRLIDFFSLFAIKVLGKQLAPDNDRWHGMFHNRAFDIWSGFAFESLCWNHVPQIKLALGIPSVETVEFSWRAEKSEEYPGAQIDLVIRRADRIIDICEMKFSMGDYIVDKKEDLAIRNRLETFKRLTKCKETIMPVMVTTYGLKANLYSQLFQNVITLDDLFKNV